MKLKIDYKTEFLLDDKLEPEQRNIEIQKILQETIQFDNASMTFESYLRIMWNKPQGKQLLDLICTYLAKMPNQNKREDKKIFSKNDLLEMEKGIRRTNIKGQNMVVEAKYRNFTDLTISEKLLIGIPIEDDDRKSN